MCKCIILFVSDFILSRMMGDTHRSIRFFVVSGGRRRVKRHVGGSLRQKIAFVSKMNYCANTNIGVVFILTGGHRSAAVFHLVGSVSPGTFMSRDTIVNMFKRNFSEVGIGWRFQDWGVRWKHSR